MTHQSGQTSVMRIPTVSTKNRSWSGSARPSGRPKEKHAARSSAVVADPEAAVVGGAAIVIAIVTQIGIMRRKRARGRIRTRTRAQGRTGRGSRRRVAGPAPAADAALDRALDPGVDQAPAPALDLRLEAPGLLAALAPAALAAGAAGAEAEVVGAAAAGAAAGAAAAAAAGAGVLLVSPPKCARLSPHRQRLHGVRPRRCGRSRSALPPCCRTCATQVHATLDPAKAPAAS